MISLPFIGPVDLPPPEWMIAFASVVLAFQALALTLAVLKLRRIVADLGGMYIVYSGPDLSHPPATLEPDCADKQKLDTASAALRDKLCADMVRHIATAP